MKQNKNNYSLLLNKEENTLSLSEESLNKAYKDNEENIEYVLSEFGLDKKNIKIDKIFNDFLNELDYLFEKIN